MRSSELVRELKKGDRRALAKAITIVENEPDQALRLLSGLRQPGNAFVVGITGPPGTGKSSLVDRLIEAYSRLGLNVGIIAVDPTSPISGGALLGDRVRMLSHATDKRVFIRSMASRGWSGGLSRATSQVIRLLDAAGFDVVLLETVGIGQSDIEVVGVSHAVMVVLMPGLGDDVQVSKAGLMEVGDIYAVNKADLEGADSMVTSLLGVLRDTRGRSPHVVKVSALTGAGIEKLLGAIEGMRGRFLGGDPEVRLRSVRGMIIETARGGLLESLSRKAELKVDRLSREVLDGRISIEEAARKLVR